ncbi:MAG: MerR family transcriptional regulator, partial [Acidimicrobiales bacterium]
CATTGLAAAEVAALERFGLVEATTVAGATYYDTEAVTVATLAGELGRYGIEPRHLRAYRNAVDREIGLVEQVVAPLLRQRNPAARQRAVESAHELARLGERLRSSLLRRELRRQLGR